MNIKLLKKLDHYDSILESSIFNTNTPIGLARGKMGFCIYYYYLSRTNNSKYKKIADRILDQIFSDITVIKSIDLKDGLLGIALGLSYLQKNEYIKGDMNIVLQDIDNLIFKKLSYSDNYKLLSSDNVIQLLYFLYERLNVQKSNSEMEFLLKELIIHTINVLYEKIDVNFFEEPPYYKIDYSLPFCFYVLGQVYKLNLYNYKIDKMLKEYSSKIYSINPTFHANKLYLFWGMNSLIAANVNGWNEYLNKLKSEFNLMTVLNNELRDKNIFFEDGLVSLYILLFNLRGAIGDRDFFSYKKLIYDRIINSSIWNLMDNNVFFNDRRGLYDGYCGVAMLFRMDDNVNYKKLYK